MIFTRTRFIILTSLAAHSIFFIWTYYNIYIMYLLYFITKRSIMRTGTPLVTWTHTHTHSVVVGAGRFTNNYTKVDTCMFRHICINLCMQVYTYIFIMYIYLSVCVCLFGGERNIYIEIEWLCLVVWMSVGCRTTVHVTTASKDNTKGCAGRPIMEQY